MKTQFSAFVSRFQRDEEGATLVEYGIALALAAAIGVSAFTTLGGDVKTNLTSAHQALTGDSTATLE